MKLRFTYLLLFCALFLGGCGYTRLIAGNLAEKVPVGNQVVISSLSLTGIPDQVSLLSDDNDNDDISSEKKKTAVSRCLSAIAFQSSLLPASGSYKVNSGLPGNWLHTSSPKYLLLRTIRV